MRKTYTIQENGQVTLPVAWRERYGLKKGDLVVFEDTSEGLLISPRQALALKLLDDIGDELADKGITLDELMERGREIRAQMVKEKYGLERKPKGSK